MPPEHFFGGLLGCMGAGAIVGALLLKQLRKKVVSNTISMWATLLFAAATLALALAPNAWLAGAVMFAAGPAWIGMLTSLNVAAQMASPGWVKHQRQHARVTHTDALDQELLNAFHIGDQPPRRPPPVATTLILSE